MDKKPFQPKSGAPGTSRKSFKNFGFVALVVLIGLIVFASLGQASPLKSVPFSDVIRGANSGQIQKGRGQAFAKIPQRSWLKYLRAGVDQP
jgi:hypothetical protein